MKINVTLVGYLAVDGLPGGFHGGWVDLPDDARVLDLLQTIHQPIPTPYLISLREQLANLDDPLQEGDTLYLIPPIGGGCKS